MAKIIVLDQETANKIAAGEVVERPASAVKELVENSLDAGARAIDIRIEEGGLKSITVVDNGCGMDLEDAKKAFVRHATSKITKVEDLDAIATLGFRGEALSSIAAVSKIYVKTRPPESSSGTAMEIQGGQIVSVVPTGCPSGTSLMVENLFFNTPARRKHMKSIAVESGLIGDVIAKIALANPQVRIRLFHDNRQVFNGGEGNLLHVLAAVYGVKVAAEMLPFQSQLDGVLVEGYVSKPTISRKSKRYIDVFVNQRYVKSNTITAAVTEAFRSVLPQGRFPIAVVKVSLAPHLVDVNIHPAKMEIKILGEQMIFDMIRSSIRKAIYTEGIVPTMVPKNMGKLLKAEVKKPQIFEGVKPPTIQEVRQTYENYHATKQKTHLVSDTVRDDLKQYVAKTPVQPRKIEGNPKEKKDKVHGTLDLPLAQDDSRALIQSLHFLSFLPPTYILCGGKDGLYVLDQHAAHERVLYEKFLHVFTNHQVSIQYLLIPQPLQLTHREMELVRENADFMQHLGVVLEDFGRDTVVLRGVPAGLSEGKEEIFVKDILDNIASQGKDFDQSNLHFAAAAAACAAAIKSGTKSGLEEADSLIQQLMKAKNPYTCPHGRPTIICITTKELATRFKRI